MSNDITFQTRILHNKHKIDQHTGAVSVSIQHATTFHQSSLDHFGKYDYSRSGNPTREALEETIAELEGGVKAFAFSSGMAAISTVFMLLSQGDHVLISEDVYGGTYRFVTSVLTRFGIEHTFVDMTNLKSIREGIRENTKVIYMETPSNPILKVTNIQKVVSIAKEFHCLTFLDNTFLTPALQRPLDFGVDVVLHSATKFLSGHSDVISGVAIVKDVKLAEKIGFLQNAFGAVLGVQDAWLVLRGLKTLHVRIKQSSESALKIAQFLNKHPLIEKVYYPGLSNHPGFDVQKRQSTGPGAVLSFQFRNEASVRIFVNEVHIPVFAVSLGAVETILSYPVKMSHAAMPKEEREKRGITDGLLRLSVGLENADDLIRDFANALAKVTVEV